MKTKIKPNLDARGNYELNLTYRHYDTLQKLVADVLVSIEHCATWAPRTMPAAIRITKEQKRLMPEEMEIMHSPVNVMEIVVDGVDPLQINADGVDQSQIEA